MSDEKLAKKHGEIRKALYPKIDEVVPAILDWIEGDGTNLDLIMKRREDVRRQYPAGSKVGAYKGLPSNSLVVASKKSWIQRLLGR